MIGASIASKVIFMTIQTYWIVYFAPDLGFSGKATILPLLLVSTGVTVSQVVANGLITMFPVSKLARYVILTAICVFGIILLFPQNPISFAALIFISFLVGKFSINISFVFFQNKIENEYRSTFGSIVSTISSVAAILLILIVAPVIGTNFMTVILSLVGCSIVAYSVMSHYNTAESAKLSRI